jgi:type IV pilus assembly protein PilA
MQVPPIQPWVGELGVVKDARYLPRRDLSSSAMEHPDSPDSASLEALESESAFTLIELMVVLLIMGILLAIAIPTFLGVSSAAEDRAAQSNLNTALVAANGMYSTLGGTFTSTSPASSLQTDEPELTFTLANTTYTTGSSTSASVVSIFPVDVATVGDWQGMVLATLSKTGYCWVVASIKATPSTVPSVNLDPVAWLVPGQYGTTTAGTFYAVFSPTTEGSACNAAVAAQNGAGSSFWKTSFPPGEAIS